MESLSVGLAVAFLAGVLSFLSPCVLPLVPSYVSFVAGVGMEELEAGGSDVRRTAFLHSVLFVAGFSAIFVGLGASASFVGQALREYQEWIMRIGGVLVVLFGLHLLGITPLRFLQRERRLHLRSKPLGFVGTFAVGLTFGAGWTPCIGPILGSILTYAATRERMVEGVQLLAVYSVGLAIPFLLSAAALSWFLATFRRFRKYIPWVERASGALLVLVGVLLLSGQFTVLAGWAARYTPEFILERI
ncbi:MAG TPA: cytochrome c biogenesis protein CcdA [Longimicrobiales bacterium]|nr:cytochrome c biogenesis protein CcdA [Longimicrobiales bacterium]